jgi:hypothetical protein
MDRAMLERHRKQAEEHVALGRQHILRQMEIVAELEENGRDATIARKLLATYQDMQEVHEADRNRIMKELANLGKNSN